MKPTISRVRFREINGLEHAGENSNIFVITAWHSFTRRPLSFGLGIHSQLPYRTRMKGCVRGLARVFIKAACWRPAFGRRPAGPICFLGASESTDELDWMASGLPLKG